MPYKNTKKHISMMKKELDHSEFRVAIFGSARTKPSDDAYKKAFELAEAIGEMGIDMVTGGGPGIMEAANAGHSQGDKDKVTENIGLTIRLPHEAQGNEYLEIREHFNNFSSRLSRFVDLASAFVIMPGGIGTVLELFYVWQLMQVKHIPNRPIILYGKMWEKLLKWVEKELKEHKLISPEDDKWIHIVHSKEEALELIKAERSKFKL